VSPVKNLYIQVSKNTDQITTPYTEGAIGSGSTNEYTGYVAENLAAFPNLDAGLVSSYKGEVKIAALDPINWAYEDN